MLARFQELSPLSLEPESEIIKLARYIVEDNNNDFTKVDLSTSINTSLAKIIFKNLFQTNLSAEVIRETAEETKIFFEKFFDEIRQ